MCSIPQRRYTLLQRSPASSEGRGTGKWRPHSWRERACASVGGVRLDRGETGTFAGCGAWHLLPRIVRGNGAEALAPPGETSPLEPSISHFLPHFNDRSHKLQKRKLSNAEKSNSNICFKKRIWCPDVLAVPFVISVHLFLPYCCENFPDEKVNCKP
ncbi:uncharacterized protein KNAG_0C02750 [Huiozyma naganishii CBS 8797]|uniref:Uncharacterized protein n=1 Tax=Huiozyma naganishii (strain ATCC MYA-139 / BCRC 22969 / CBS 8797 / KCTC 17520 / NBRC 10181 / NCYC 3082 / Yp74L-3) TaxID=1071383 RepID=J7S5V1_HUIN7|nr:hypothetical protein KNAG_0C02750 [Kazachstania naganishii CBS 8797]CCK69386.1 hypothetical protein KNAG_0C02750 [Kazachstania naganishii CBS 8797]